MITVNSEFLRCTGIFISFKHVLAAVHCVKLSLLYGSNDITNAKISKVTKISVPELFNSTQAELRGYDIAIIHLQFRLGQHKMVYRQYVY
uniref:Peptidase S1 domain-containing protein n=1 Tax=Globodera pallida TaxID=36090 RepID=A0A183BJ30_GLOPA